jgi:hypothetical protein
LYADRFYFEVIDWRQPPFDPRDLALTIQELSSTDVDVLIVDSGSPFWRGSGGTLDIADGRFGGWKTATPAQDDLVAAILSASFHVIFCTRAKQTYEVEQEAGGRQTVRKLGLAPIQRDDLEYEFQVVAMIDTEHRIDVGKTRCADLAGASFHANQQAAFARTYKDWLDQGPTVIRQIDADVITLAFAAMTDRQERADAKGEFVGRFGRPSSLGIEVVAEAWAWLSARLGVEPHPFAEPDDEGAPCATCGLDARAGWHTTPPDEPETILPASESPAEPETAPIAQGDPSGPETPVEDEQPSLADAEPSPTVEDVADPGGLVSEPTPFTPPEPDVNAHVAEMSLTDVVAELERRGVPSGGTPKVVRKRLIDVLNGLVRPPASATETD